MDEHEARLDAPFLRPGLEGSDAEVTIVVSPRERFRIAPRSLARMLATADAPFHLVYVDGGSPAPVAEALRASAERHGFELIRSDRFLPPNTARNLGLARVDTPYVLFVDNDVVFEPHWLSLLMDCARRSGAALVSPLTLQGDPSRLYELPVHFAGGAIALKPSGDHYAFHHVYDHADQAYGAVADRLVSGPTECVEFHCVLARTDVLRRIGGLDERLCGTSEHFDISLEMQSRGERIYLEPAAIAINDISLPLDWSERPYFCLRWSGGWWKRSERAFQSKWDLGESFSKEKRDFIRDHRLHGFPARRLSRYLGWRPMVAVVNVVSETVAWLNQSRSLLTQQHQLEAGHGLGRAGAEPAIGAGRVADFPEFSAS